MKIVPVIKSRDLHFYTGILDFKRKWPGFEAQELANGVIDLVCDGAELQLSRHAGDGVFGSVNRVFAEDVDERFRTFALEVSTPHVDPSLHSTPPPSIRPGVYGSSPSQIRMAIICASARRSNGCRQQPRNHSHSSDANPHRVRCRLARSSDTQSMLRSPEPSR